MSSRTVIRNGLVITASRRDPRRRPDQGRQGRRPRRERHPGSQSWTAERTIDATGKYVIQGGVDAHTHMELPFGGTFASDTFETGTRAAAWGGAAIVDFAVQSVGRSLREGLDAWNAGDSNCAIDYAFHMIVSDVDGSASRRWTCWSRRASPPSSSSWPTPASSTATTVRSCTPCSAPPRTAA